MVTWGCFGGGKRACGAIYSQYILGFMESLKFWLVTDFVLCPWKYGKSVACDPSTPSAARRASLGNKGYRLSLPLIMGHNVRAFLLKICLSKF